MLLPFVRRVFLGAEKSSPKVYSISDPSYKGSETDLTCNMLVAGAELVTIQN